MLCVSKRHLRTLCKLQADVISDAILNTTASNEYTCKRHPEHISMSTSYTQCNENIIVNNDFVHEANENHDTCIQIANYDECRESSNLQSDVQSFILFLLKNVKSQCLIWYLKTQILQILM